MFRRGFTPIHLLLALAAVAIVATAVVYTAQRFQPAPAAPAANANIITNVNEVANANTAANTNSATNVNVTADAMAGWKTFSNTTYNWSIQYPPTWQLTDTRNEDQDINVETTFSKGAVGTHAFFSGPVVETMDQWKQQQEATYPNTPVTETTIGGEKAYRIDAPNGFTYAVAQKGNVQVRVTSSNGALFTSGIVATFQFTDQTAATADWKTYTNKTFGWSVKYPPSWKPVLNDDETPDIELIFNGATGLQKFYTVRKPDPLWTDNLNDWLKRVPDVPKTTHDITVDGVPGKWVETSVADGYSYIAFRKGDVFVSVTSTNAEMITNGMLDTFHFTN